MVSTRSAGVAALVGILWASLFLNPTQTLPLSSEGFGAEFNSSLGDSDTAGPSSYNSSATRTNSHRPKRFVQGLMIGATALGLVSQGYQIYSQINDASKKTSSDQAIGDGFQKTFQSLDRNYEQIVNVKESIDQMMYQNQFAFSGINEKIDRYADNTVQAMNGIGNKIDYRVSEILNSMNHIDKINDQRSTATLNALNTINSENNRRAAAALDAISVADKNSHQRAQATWVAIDAVDKNNGQRTAEVLGAIKTADENGYNRTASILGGIDTIDRRNDERAKTMLDVLSAIDRKNGRRTAATMTATSIADKNNHQRFVSTQQAINESDSRNHLRALATWGAIDATDKKNDQRATEIRGAINAADRNNYNRTVTMLGAINTVGRRVDERANATLESLNAIDRNNGIRTLVTLNATAIADRNNHQRFALTLDAIGESERNNMERSAATLQAIIATNSRIDNRTASTLRAIGVADKNNLGRTIATLGTINASDRRNEHRASEILSGLYTTDQNNHRRIMAAIGAVSRADRGIALNFAALLQIFEVVTESYQSMETLRFQMGKEFNRILDYSQNSRIEFTISKLKNFIQYYETEKLRISKLSRDQRINTLLDEHGLLPHLRESRTPRGDSLQSFMFEVMNQGYAIPTDENDTVSISALSALFYGCHTQVSVMYYLIQQYIYLADDCYRTQDLQGYNNYIDTVVTVFEGFRNSLIGSASTPGLIDKIINIIKQIATSEFILVHGNTYAHLMKLVTLLDTQKSNLLESSLPIIPDVPPKLTAQIKFDKSSPRVPLGPWEAGAKVSYAVQYRNQNNWYSKVGEWSTPFKVKTKSNPSLKVPANSMYTRLLFRRINNNEPEFVGILDNENQVDFIDIDRDLYNSASSSDEELAMDEANVLIGSGANVSAVFEFGRSFLHAAAISNNVELVRQVLSNSSNILDINAVDYNGYTPLHLAAEAGSVDFIELMLAIGADVNAKNILGSTALHLASASGYTSAVQALTRSKELDINSQDNTGASPLHRAILSGVVRNVKTLLSHNQIDNNVRSNGGLSPLHLSAVVKFPEVTETLIQSYGTNLNSRSDGNLSALHLAVITGNLHALRLLSGLDGTDMNPQSVNGWTPLHYAVSLQKKDMVFELLNYGNVIVDVPGKGRITPLHLAATTGKNAIILELIAHGADVELPTVDGLTAYHLAAINNNHDAMKILADNGANINAKTVNGSTPMHLAAANGHVQSVLSLLEMRNVRLDLRDDHEETPIGLAEKNGHQYIAAKLKDRTGDFDVWEGGNNANSVEDKNAIPIKPPSQNPTTEEVPVETDKAAWLRYELERVAYHKAAGQGYLPEVEALLNKGMDVDSRDHNGYTALHGAAGNGHVSMVAFLIEHGASPNARGNDGLTPLVHSIFNNQTNVVTKLLELGATVGSSSSDTVYRMDPFHVAVLQNNTDMMRLLADKEDNLNAKLFQGYTALHLAAKQGNIESVEFLLGCAVNVNTKNDEGETPLQIAEKGGHNEVAQLIREKIKYTNNRLVEATKLGSLHYVKKLAGLGGDLNLISQSDKNATLCHLASSSGFFEVAKFLIENGCDVNSENQDGERILHVAGFRIAEYVAVHGANLNPRTNSGNTPLHYAAARGDAATVGLLVRLLNHHDENIDAKNDDGQSPLSFALNSSAPADGHGLLAVVKHLVGGGANLNTVDINGQTPLIHAAAAGLTDVVKHIVDLHADIGAKGTDNDTALDKAFKKDHTEIVKHLIQHGAIGTYPVHVDGDEEEDEDEDDDSGSFIQWG